MLITLVSPDNVWMFQLLEQRDFTDSGGWDAFVLRLKPYPLESYNITGVSVPRLIHDSICTLPDSSEPLVALHFSSAIDWTAVPK